ncbi:MAG: hypothetical protein CMJ46_04150 [Planctomyces sp.]|nr:hypothetical protein [Planctomyces sp.]
MDAQPDYPQTTPCVRRLRWITIALFFLLWFALSFGVHDARAYVLQHLLTGVAWIVIFLLMRYRLLTEPGFYCCIAFLVLHLIGARYFYSLVPYEKWLNSFFGFTLEETFGWERNHYDRFVHFWYGVLLSVPTWNLYARFLTKSRLMLMLLTLQTILATSTLYELAEWILTMVVAPAMAENYNGQQGDMWDTQKDVALAFAGSAITCGVLWWNHRVPTEKSPPNA